MRERCGPGGRAGGLALLLAPALALLLAGPAPARADEEPLPPPEQRPVPPRELPKHDKGARAPAEPTVQGPCVPPRPERAPVAAPRLAPPSPQVAAAPPAPAPPPAADASPLLELAERYGLVAPSAPVRVQAAPEAHDGVPVARAPLPLVSPAAFDRMLEDALARTRATRPPRVQGRAPSAVSPDDIESRQTYSISYANQVAAVVDPPRGAVPPSETPPETPFQQRLRREFEAENVLWRRGIVRAALPPAAATRERPIRRWHARPAFDRWIVEQRGGWTIQRVEPGDVRAAVPAPITLAATETDVPPRPAESRNLLIGASEGTLLPAFPDWLALETFQLTATVVFGGSSASDEELQFLQAADTDPREKKFFQPDWVSSARGGARLFKFVDVDALLAIRERPEDGELEVELEELEVWKPIQRGGLNVRVGRFRTPFGIHNMRPSVDRVWIESPIVTTRLLGPRGLVADLGAEIVYQDRAGWRLHLGAQNADGEGMLPFLWDEGEARENTFRGRLGGRRWVDESGELWSKVVLFARAQHQFTLSRDVGAALGASHVAGPNATGKDGRTYLAGVDLFATGPPLWGDRCDPRQGWRLQGEGLYRWLEAETWMEGEDTPDPGDDLVIPGETIEDWGFYLQALHSVGPVVRIGVRGEWVTGRGQSYELTGGGAAAIARGTDPFRDDRWRLVPILVWRPLNTLGIRLEYSYDRPSHLDEPVHSLWIAFDGDWGQLNLDS